ncbi:MAG: hypothetical protein LIP10_02260 [Clostridiales bacterium]|nr:hypothetical protein [Clostridiales bacterium]
MAEELDMTFSEIAAEMDRLILSKNYPDLKVYLKQLKNGLNLYTQSECFLLV